VVNSVDIGSVVNTHGVDDPFGLVDAIGHRYAPRRAE
jgi:hypothetical protein